MSETLVAAYSEANRHYHTLDHIGACLHLAADAPLPDSDRDAVEYALWFHDIVYDPRREDNEERSARMVHEWMEEVGVADAERVAGLVRMTAGHRVGPQADLAARVVCDVDLSVLGSSPAAYGRYVHQIRSEYEWLPEEEFRSGRRQMLRTFLEADHIYSLPPYVEIFEDQARLNMTQELASLAT
ncbi:MAG: metal-dependent phosphohydrolase [Acidimicrobiales bacterium]